MTNSVFRKSSLERINAPEQLNEYLRVASPGLWFVLAGIGAVLAAFLTWGIFGHVLETVEITGTVLVSDNNELAVYSFLPIEQARPLAEGMSVQVSPTYAAREQYGYLFGQIRSVGRMPITAEEVRNELGDDARLLSLPDGNLIEVVVDLESDANGNLVWSRPEGNGVDVLVGSTCNLTVITAERRPIEMFFRRAG